MDPSFVDQLKKGEVEMEEIVKLEEHGVKSLAHLHRLTGQELKDEIGITKFMQRKLVQEIRDSTTMPQPQPLPPAATAVVTPSHPPASPSSGKPDTYAVNLKSALEAGRMGGDFTRSFQQLVAASPSDAVIPLGVFYDCLDIVQHKKAVGLPVSIRERLLSVCVVYLFQHVSEGSKLKKVRWTVDEGHRQGALKTVKRLQAVSKANATNMDQGVTQHTLKVIQLLLQSINGAKNTDWLSMLGVSLLKAVAAVGVVAVGLGTGPLAPVIITGAVSVVAPALVEFARNKWCIFKRWKYHSNVKKLVALEFLRVSTLRSDDRKTPAEEVEELCKLLRMNVNADWEVLVSLIQTVADVLCTWKQLNANAAKRIIDGYEFSLEYYARSGRGSFKERTNVPVREAATRALNQLKKYRRVVAAATLCGARRMLLAKKERGAKASALAARIALKTLQSFGRFGLARQEMLRRVEAREARRVVAAATLQSFVRFGLARQEMLRRVEAREARRVDGCGCNCTVM